MTFSDKLINKQIEEFNSYFDKAKGHASTGNADAATLSMTMALFLQNDVTIMLLMNFSKRLELVEASLGIIANRNKV